MGDNTGTDSRSALRRALQRLTNGEGVLREDLVEALQGDLRELQHCWRVNVNGGSRVALDTVILNLEAHIAKLSPRPSRQDLSPQGRRQQYEQAIMTCFNVRKNPELIGKDLTQRQAWLAGESRRRLRIDESTCRRDLRDALDQIEQQILDPDYQPVQIGEVPDDVRTTPADVPAEPEPVEATLLSAPILSEPETAVRPEPGPPRVVYLWPPRFTRRSAAIAALIAVVCAGLGALGIEIATGNLLVAAKPATKQLQAPHTVSEISVCHEGGNSMVAIRTPAGIVLNFGVLNVSAGGSKWELNTNADYNQVVDAALDIQNQSEVKRDIGVTAQLIQPFAHKGNTWTVTWRITAAGKTTDISAPIHLDSSDEKLVYLSGDTSTWDLSVAAPKRSPVVDADILDPSQPFQTLTPNQEIGIQAQFRVVIPSLAIVVSATNSRIGSWLQTLYAEPGETLTVEITVRDDGNTKLYGTTVGLSLAEWFSYIPGSTSIGSSTTARGKPLPDGIIVPNWNHLGINLGTLLPGQQFVVRLKIHVDNSVHHNVPLNSTGAANVAELGWIYNILRITVQ